MWLAANPTALHPDDVVAALGPSPDRRSLEQLRASVNDVPEAEWERDLLDALLREDADARAALVNEQLTELDLRMQRWARVPRACASLSTSFGVLLGTLVLRSGLANAPDLSGELGELFVRDVMSQAVSVAAFGVVGTAFCIAAHAHARRMTQARVEASDRMIEQLEAAAARPGGPKAPRQEDGSMARNPPAREVASGVASGEEEPAGADPAERAAPRK